MVIKVVKVRLLALIIIWLVHNQASAQDASTIMLPTVDQPFDTIEIPSLNNRDYTTNNIPKPRVDSYQPLGLRLGSFTAYPELETTVGYTDNVNLTKKKTDSVTTIIKPALRLQSNWSRHYFEVNLLSSHELYEDSSADSTNGLRAGFKSRADVSHDTNIEFNGSYELAVEAKGSNELPQGSKERPKTHSFSSDVKLNRHFNRLNIGLRTRFDAIRYEDTKLNNGGISYNSKRNNYGLSGGLRVGYDLSNRIKPFIDFEYTKVIYVGEADDSGLDRDSHGYKVSTGLEFEFSPMLSGELSGGYTRRSYDDKNLETADGITVGASLNWRPTTITTVTVGASTGVEETSIAGVSGYLNHKFDFSLEHKLRRNIIADISAAYEINDYVGGGGR